jgi:hypothetical protein
MFEGKPARSARKYDGLERNQWMMGDENRVPGGKGWAIFIIYNCSMTSLVL